MAKKVKVRVRKKGYEPNTCNLKLDYEQLKKSIIDSYFELEQIKAERQKIQEDKEKEECKQNSRKLIGYKEYPDDENLFFKTVHFIRNFLVMLIRFIFFKKENIKSDSTTYAIIQATTSGIYGLIKWGFYALSLYLFVKTFLFSVDWQTYTFYWHFRGEFLYYSVFSFIIARAFRITVFEIENIEDRTYLLSIFTCTTSFFAMLLALISLFKEQ